MSRCHIFSACPPIWYFIEVLSSSRVVSVARAPIVIVLQWYRYSQAQQQVKAFFSPLQMSEDPGMLDSSCCHIKTHQNYNSWGTILPESLFTLIDKSNLPPPAPAQHQAQSKYTQLLWPHESNPYGWASYYTDCSSSFLMHFFCCRNMHRSRKDSLFLKMDYNSLPCRIKVNGFNNPKRKERMVSALQVGDTGCNRKADGRSQYQPHHPTKRVHVQMPEISCL